MASCVKSPDGEEIIINIPEGLIKSITSYNYSAKEENGSISREKLIEKKEVIFNLVGNKIEERHYDLETNLLIYYILYKYNTDNQITEKAGYNANGQITSKITYKYDFKGRKIKEKHIDIIGNTFDEIHVFSYNRDGNKCEENQITGDGLWLRGNSYILNSYGDVIERIHYFQLEPDTISWSANYKYDAKQRLIGENIFDSKHRLGTIVTYKYDEKGNLVEWNEIHPMYSILDKSLFYSYHSFDKHENWLLRKTINKEKLVGILEREIEYH